MLFIFAAPMFVLCVPHAIAHDRACLIACPAGKSTLLKLMTGDLAPLDGLVKRHNHLKIGMYHQHLTELLDPALNPLEYMVRCLSSSIQRIGNVYAVAVIMHY